LIAGHWGRRGGSNDLSRRLAGERDRARAIFRWIAENIAYDTHGLATKSYGDLSPESVLSRRTAVCQGYAELFRALGKTAGLSVVTISGHAKGYNYAVGESFDGDPSHAWNAVKVQGRWRLLDCTWGAGHVDERGRFVKELADHYFLTRPTEFIYDHFPVDFGWQLLDPPLSKREFEERVHVKPSFFRNKLELVSHWEGTIRVHGETVVTLRSPAGTALLAELRRRGEAVSLTIDKAGPLHRIRVPVLGPGEYILRVYATSDRQSGRYEWALDYKVESSGMGPGQ
jgi:transglutaminase/protease-like cytokinesis protein 3